MQKIYFWIGFVFFLYGETYTSGSFGASITSSFSVTVDNKTLIREFTPAEITANAASSITMGTFAVTFNDTTTMGGQTHTTTITSNYVNGTTMRLQRFLNNGNIDATTLLNLVVTSNRSINGTAGGPFTLVNNSIVRRRNPADGNINNEVHTITIKVAANQLNILKPGRYKNFLLLTLASF
jgi:hypothetical protein